MIIEIKYCNKCGKAVEEEVLIHSISLGFGYGSKHDNQAWRFELCEDCILDMVKGFKLTPKGFNEGIRTPETTGASEHQMIFENWQKTGKWEEMMCVPYEDLLAYRDYYEDEYINECIKKYHPNKPLLE